MIEDSEMLAGLAFLERYAHPDFSTALRTAIDMCVVVRQKRKLNEKRELTIDKLELSVRTANAIKSMGCSTLGDVEAMLSRESTEELMARGKRHYFGKKCLKEVRMLLNDMGFFR